ncbi:hypothetical protein [Xanthomonas sp. 3075]|uniref:hypothetical protein n=1 Tax=Xanthomonas sp. 3075 TaxID=3035315 RepID=UPI00161A8547|nr:hypothetical protein [Xanthomonas sp. 3075]MBB4132383.1 hypothetical protein [Xanthomonas sp. 3075]
MTKDTASQHYLSRNKTLCISRKSGVSRAPAGIIRGDFAAMQRIYPKPHLRDDFCSCASEIEKNAMEMAELSPLLRNHHPAHPGGRNIRKRSARPQADPHSGIDCNGADALRAKPQTPDCVASAASCSTWPNQTVQTPQWSGRRR